MLHRIDKETDHRQFVGHPFEIRFLWHVFGTGKMADFLGALVQGRHCAFLAHDRQRTGNLMQRCTQGGKLVALVRVTEEGVEHLLDLRQIALNLLRHLTNQQFFLRLARHFVEQRNFRTGLRRRSGNTGVDARHGDIDLIGKIAPQALEILLRILRQQDGRGDFHQQRITVPCAIVRQPVGRNDDGLGQTPVIGVSQLLNRRGKRRGMIPERW